MRTTLDITRQRPDLETSNSPQLCTLDTLPPRLRYAHRIKCGLYHSIGPDDLSSTHPARVPSDAMDNDGSNESSAQEVSGSHTGWNFGCRRFLLSPYPMSTSLHKETQKRNSAINLVIERVTTRTYSVTPCASKERREERKLVSCRPRCLLERCPGSRGPQGQGAVLWIFPWFRGEVVAQSVRCPVQRRELCI